MFVTAFAQEAQAGAATAAAQSPILGFMPFFLIIGIIYFLIIRPQKKSQDDHARMIAALGKNDEIVTSGGIYGTVVNIQEDSITVRVDDNTRIKVQKTAVSRLVKSRGTEE